MVLNSLSMPMSGTVLSILSSSRISVSLSIFDLFWFDLSLVQDKIYCGTSVHHLNLSRSSEEDGCDHVHHLMQFRILLIALFANQVLHYQKHLWTVALMCWFRFILLHVDKVFPAPLAEEATFSPVYTFVESWNG